MERKSCDARKIIRNCDAECDARRGVEIMLHAKKKCKEELFAEIFVAPNTEKSTTNV